VDISEDNSTTSFYSSYIDIIKLTQ